MCPDDALLSAFVDDEVPSPWKERMESHIAGCRRCFNKIEAFRSLKLSIAAPADKAEIQALSAAKARIGASIDFGAAGRPTRAGFWNRFQRIWTQRIPLPMPFVAAGAAALLFLAGMALSILGPFSGARGTMASASETISSQSATIEMMAQYMKQQSAQPVMIEMPQESVFDQLGNPLIVSSSEPVIQEVTTTSYGSGSR